MAASGPYVVEARGLLKRYGDDTVVDHIDLRVPRGGCFGLLGPNGAGKTTTLRMILGQSPPSGGTLDVLGESMPAAGRRVRARIGVVSQDDNLDPDFTVMENLEVYTTYFPSRVRGPLRPYLESLLEFVSLEDRAGSRIPALSGGMRRRLVIARALVNDPVLLILDEPTTGLDPQIRHLIWARLRALTERGTTVLLTTHYMEEAERLCDRIAIIDRGRILAEDAPPARWWRGRSSRASSRCGRASGRRHRSSPARPGSRPWTACGTAIRASRVRCSRAFAITRSSNTCIGPRTWRTCSSGSPGASSGTDRRGTVGRRSLAPSRAARACVRRLAAQRPGVAPPRGVQPPVPLR